MKNNKGQALVDYVNDTMVVNEHVFILRTNNLINSKFLFYYLYSEQGQLMMEPLKTRGGQGGINGTKIKTLSVPNIEKALQEKIIFECDKIMNSIADKKKRKEISKIIMKYLIIAE